MYQNVNLLWVDVWNKAVDLLRIPSVKQCTGATITDDFIKIIRVESNKSL